MPSSQPEPLPASAFTALGRDTYRASGLTRGLWNPLHQHAGPSIALACRGFEVAAGRHGLTHIARITANLLRPVPIGDLRLEVAPEYVGRNVGHFSGRLLAGDKAVAIYTALAHRATEVRLPEDLPGHPLPSAPRTVEASVPAHFPRDGRYLGYSDLVDARVASGAFFQGPCAVWFRMRHPLLDTEPTSVYQRVAVFADSNNGISAILDFKRYVFVNSDLTIHLLRPPVGEWICLDARTHLGPQGCGHAQSAIYDTRGLVGRALQTLVVSAVG
jgi:hypothetical protein